MHPLASLPAGAFYQGASRSWFACANDHAGTGCITVFPALGAGQLFGQPVTGFVSPLSTSVVIGAFIFGIGMQLGGGCASGTLYTVGGGSARMVVTLIFFCLGSCWQPCIWTGGLTCRTWRLSLLLKVWGNTCFTFKLCSLCSHRAGNCLF